MTGDTPTTSTMSKVFYGATKTARTQVAYVQNVPEFLKPPEGVNYSALDIPDERMAPGRIKAESLEIEILFTQENYQALKAQNGKKNFWFIQLPEATAKTATKPLTWTFEATSYIGIGELSIDDMIKAKITLYRSGEIVETEGFPTA